MRGEDRRRASAGEGGARAAAAAGSGGAGGGAEGREGRGGGADEARGGGGDTFFSDSTVQPPQPSFVCGQPITIRAAGTTPSTTIVIGGIGSMACAPTSNLELG